MARPGLDAAIAYRIRRSASGAVFLGAFGTAWLAWGLISMQRPGLAAAACLPGAAVVLAAILLRRGAPGPEVAEHARWRRRFLRINLMQWAAIAAAAAALSSLDLADALPEAISVIVAVHFLPLARDFPAYYATAAALAAIDAAALWAGGDRGAVIAATGTGAALWGTALAQLVRGRRLRGSAADDPQPVPQPS